MKKNMINEQSIVAYACKSTILFMNAGMKAEKRLELSEIIASAGGSMISWSKEETFNSSPLLHKNNL